MFHVSCDEQSVVYTGDFNTTPDRHLGAASIPSLRPTLLITEATYATTIRESKRCREREFLMLVHETINRGGKVSCERVVYHIRVSFAPLWEAINH